MALFNFLWRVKSKTCCQTCGDPNAAACMVCGTFVCPGHRWSTGNPKDGYYCVDSWCIPKQKTVFSIPPWANEIVDAALPPAAPIERPPDPPKGRPLLWGAVVALSILLLLILFSTGCT